MYAPAIPHVSGRSAFGDTFWDFDGVPPATSGSARRVNWAFEIGGGRRFDELAFEALCTTSKCFLLSLRHNPPAPLLPRADQSLVRTFTLLRALLRWMHEQGLSRFAALDHAAASRFIQAMAGQRHNRTGEPLKPSTILRYKQLLNELWLQAPLLDDALAENPLDAEQACQLWPPHRINANPLYTPDEVVVPLLSAAMRLVGQPADDVIALRDLVQNNYDRTIANGLPQTHAGFRAIEAAGDFHFTTLARESDPWEPAPLRSTKRLRFLIDRMVDACFVLIAWFVGPRCAEIINLEVGCIEWRAAADGTESYAYLVGRIYKGEGKGGRPHRWVVPEPVVRAVQVLERIIEPMRQRVGSNALWLAMGSSGVIGPAARIFPTPAHLWLRRLNSYFAPYIGLPDYLGRTWHLTTRQGRTTFSRLVAKRDRTGLDALRAHLGHINRGMTDRHYVGTDFDLVQLIDRHAREETRAALEALMIAPHLGGRAGRTIAAASRFRGRVIDMEVRQWVDHVLRETEMRLGVCDWGWCLYRKESAACLGDETGPNPTLRTESVCASCANFAVGPRHRIVWIARRERNQKLLTWPNLDPESRALAEARIAECDRILLDLDEPKIIAAPTKAIS